MENNRKYSKKRTFFIFLKDKKSAVKIIFRESSKVQKPFSEKTRLGKGIWKITESIVLKNKNIIFLRIKNNDKIFSEKV